MLDKRRNVCSWAPFFFFLQRYRLSTCTANDKRATANSQCHASQNKPQRLSPNELLISPCYLPGETSQKSQDFFTRCLRYPGGAESNAIGLHPMSCDLTTSQCINSDTPAGGTISSLSRWTHNLRYSEVRKSYTRAVSTPPNPTGWSRLNR